MMSTFVIADETAVIERNKAIVQAFCADALRYSAVAFEWYVDGDVAPDARLVDMFTGR